MNEKEFKVFRFKLWVEYPELREEIFGEETEESCDDWLF